jgi:hypothetical protein
MRCWAEVHQDLVAAVAVAVVVAAVAAVAADEPGQ